MYQNKEGAWSNFLQCEKYGLNIAEFWSVKSGIENEVAVFDLRSSIETKLGEYDGLQFFSKQSSEHAESIQILSEMWQHIFPTFTKKKESPACSFLLPILCWTVFTEYIHRIQTTLQNDVSKYQISTDERKNETKDSRETFVLRM